MKFKMNALEKKWVLYDVGNSAFTLLVSTIMPIYFNYLAGNAGISDVDYLPTGAMRCPLSTILVAILGPTLGTASDLKGWKKKVFLGSLLVGAIGCVALGFMQSWLWFLVLFVIAKSAYSLSLVVYDSMLTDIAPEDRMDEVSARGYAWGYIGSCIPFILSLLLVLFYENLGITMGTGHGNRVSAGGGLVAAVDGAASYFIPSGILSGGQPASCPCLRQKTGRCIFRSGKRTEGSVFPDCLFLLY